MLEIFFNLLQRYGPVLIWVVLTIVFVTGVILYAINKISLIYVIYLGLCFIVASIFGIAEHFRKNNPQHKELRFPEVSFRIQKIFDILYVILFIVAVLTLYFYDVRPLLFFIVIAALAGVVGISIFFTQDNHSSQKNILKIIFLSFLSTLSIFKIYILIGYDTWTHLAWNALIVQFGFIYSGLSKEVATPIQHIATAIVDVVLGINIILASIIALSIPLILLSTGVFIIGKKLFNVKFGLLGMLIYISMSPVIYWVSAIQTTSYAYMLIIPILLSYIKWRETNHKNNLYVVLIVVLMAIYVHSHTYSLLFLVGIFFSIYLGSVVIDRKILTKELILPLVSVAIVFVNLISYSWNGVGDLSIFSVIAQLFKSSLNAISNPLFIEVALPKYVNIIPPSIFEECVDTMLEIMLVLSTVLLLLVATQASKSPKFKYQWMILWVLLGLMTLKIMAAFLLFSMGSRVDIYLCLILGFSICCILYYYTTIHPISPRWHVVFPTICVLFVIILAFTGIANTEVNFDNPLWMEDNFESDGVTVGEAIGIETLIQYIPNKGDDMTYDHTLSPVYGYYRYLQAYNEKTNTEVSPSVNPSLIRWHDLDSADERYLIFREELLTRPTMQYYPEYNYMQYIKLDANYKNVLNIKYNLLYSNQELYLYQL